MNNANRFLICTLSLIILGMANVATAEETPPVKEPASFTLAEAVGRALEVDEEYQSAAEDLVAAEAAINAAKASFFPTVTLDISASQIFGLPKMVIPANSMGPGFPPTDVEFSPGFPRNVSAGVTAAQPLYMGGRTWTAYRIAKAARALAEEKRRQAKVDVIHAAIKAYYGAVLAEEAVRVANTSVAVAQSHVQATEDRYNAGLVSEYDVLRARVQLSNLETARRQAEDNLAMAYRVLRGLLDLPSDQPLALKDRLRFEIQPFKLEEALATSLTRRPEVVQLELSRELAVEKVNIAKTTDNPTAMFVASYSDYANEFTLDFADEWEQQTTLALSFSWPLFDGFLTRAKVRQARAELRKSELAKARLTEGVEIEVRRAYDALATAEANVRAQKENVGLAERGLEIAQARYEAGLMSNLEVLDAQAALTQAQLGYYRALYDYELAKYEFRRARGDLDEVSW